MSGKFAEAILGIRHTFHVRRSCMHEPLKRLIGAVQRQQHFGVRVAETSGSRTGSLRIRRGARQQAQGLFGLTEIEARPGRNDTEFIRIVTGELRSLVAPRQFDCLFRPTHSAFTIRDQRKQLRLAPHPSSSAELRQRLSPVACLVGRNPHSLPDRGDPACPPPRRLCVRQSRLWILIEKLARGHQMPGHSIGRGSIQGRKFAADFGRQLFGFDIRRNRRAAGSTRDVAIGRRPRLRLTSPPRP